MRRACTLCKRSFLSRSVKLYGKDKHIAICNDCVTVIESIYLRKDKDRELER